MRSSLPTAALALCAALAGCTREAETTPFRASVTRDGASALPASPRVDLVDLVAGTAQRIGDGTVVITPATGGPVTLTFDTSTRVRLPPPPYDGVWALRLAYDLDAVDPDGRPVPVLALRLSDVSGPRFILAEGSVRLPSGLPTVVAPAGPEAFGDQVPLLNAVSGRILFEPSRCGDQYYDFLDVSSIQGGRLFTLGRGEERTVTLPEGGDPWTVRHVLTWHRVGSGCAGRPNAWIQAAAWR
jgi:hypothetical protein